MKFPTNSPFLLNDAIVHLLLREEAGTARSSLALPSARLLIQSMKSTAPEAQKSTYMCSPHLLSLLSSSSKNSF